MGVSGAWAAVVAVDTMVMSKLAIKESGFIETLGVREIVNGHALTVKTG